MKLSLKFSTGIWVFGPAIDRFCTKGYRKNQPLEKRLERASKIEGLKGIEFHYPTNISEKNVEETRALLKALKLEPVLVEPALGQESEWKSGALCALKEETRRAAIERAKASMDIAEILGAPMIVIWPGQDGYDYPFQVDYSTVWNLFVESLREIAEHNSEIKVALEYKQEEPRSYVLMGNVGKTLNIIQELGLDNVGVNIEIAHALMANENPAESISLINRYHRLFHTHLNDGFGRIDNDLMAGTVNFWQWLEILHYLEEANYDGWYGLDLTPHQEEPTEAVRESIQNIKCMLDLIHRIDEGKLREALSKADSVKTQRILRAIFTR